MNNIINLENDPFKDHIGKVKPIILVDLDESKLYGDIRFACEIVATGYADEENRIIYCTNLKDIEDWMISKIHSPQQSSFRFRRIFNFIYNILGKFKRK